MKKPKKVSRICQVYPYEDGWMITYTPYESSRPVNVLLDSANGQRARKEAQEFCKFPLANIRLTKKLVEWDKLKEEERSEVEVQPVKFDQDDRNDPQPDKPISKLDKTNRDRILALALKGERTKDIATELGLSSARVSTVKTQLKAAGLLKDD